MANPRQIGLFDQIHPIQADIRIKENHELLKLTKLIAWPDLIEAAQGIRASKVKALVGPEPHYRELLGAIALMSVRQITYRQAEDLIAHYAPARYLCNLMDSTWNPDHITIFEFTQMMGPEGMDIFNKTFLSKAADLGILDPSKLMSDTTAQEAMIPYPNEVGLMKRFTDLTVGALKKVGGKFSGIKGKAIEIAAKVKGLVRRSHLFAKTKEQKRKVGKKLYHTARELHGMIKSVLSSAERKLHGKASQEIERLSKLMDTLFPQILYFLETGFVASKKIIHLQMSELYSIVRGKAGKSVEFGLKWGINRIDGFVLGFLLNGGGNASDKRFCLQSIKEHIELFGEAPKTFGFDRGGYSPGNLKKAKKLGVKNVGIAPVGKAKWSVSEKMSEVIRRERAQVEGVIGSVKSKKYGFNKPNVKSTRAMETSGHRSCLGFNLCKALRKLNEQQLQMA
jgi:transposase, IS5 family